MPHCVIADPDDGSTDVSDSDSGNPDSDIDSDVD